MKAPGRLLTTVLFLAAASPIYAAGPALPPGDPAAKTAVQPLLQPLYSAVNQADTERVFGLTRGNPLELEGALGTELQGSFAGRYARIVAFVHTPRGHFAAEFYFVDGQLRFTYETCEFFEETPAASDWRNFKGLPAWERRVYFGETGTTFAEGQGTPDAALAPAPDRLRERGQTLRALLEARRKRR